MSTIATEEAALSREPQWLLKITVKYCDEENGVGPCTAATQCYYTYSTCYDTANYNLTDKVYQYCNRGARIQGAMPYLDVGFNHLPTRINPGRFKTERGQMTFTLRADTGHPFANADKIGYTASDAGTNYWPSWIKRHDNFRGRIAELYKGYAGVAADDFELSFRGVIEDIDYSESDVKVIVRDMLWKAVDARAPVKIPTTVVLLADPGAAGVTIQLDDGTGSYDPTDHFPAATAKEPMTVKIENEYIIYTGISSNDLTGCTRGAYGSTAATHAIGKKIKHVLIYANNDGATWALCTLVLPDLIFVDLLCNWAGIDGSEYLATEDVDTLQDGGVDDAVTTWTCSDTDQMPTEGVLLCGSELATYTGIDGADIIGIVRGMYGTTAAAHADDVAVKPLKISFESNRWHYGSRLKYRFDKSNKVKTLLNKLIQDTMEDQWQNEGGKIDAKIQAPPLFGTAPSSFTKAGIKDESRKVSMNSDMRITRVACVYSASKADPGTDSDNFDDVDVYLSAVHESKDWFDESREEVVYSEGIAREAEANWLSSRRFTRFSENAPRVWFSLEIKDGSLDVGDLVYLTVPEIVDETGAPEERLFEVLSKKRKGEGSIQYESMDTGFGGHRYGLIAPASVTADWDSQTDEEKEIYFTWCDSNSVLGTNDDDGKRFF